MSKSPWHLWTVGIVTLLWNLVGAYDYLMTQTENEAYMARFTPEQLEYYYGFPIWVESCWAIAIWGGVLGSLLLLLRRGWAAPVFLVSLVAMVANAIYNFGFSRGLEMMGTGGLIFTIVIFLIHMIRVSAGKGVLR